MNNVLVLIGRITKDLELRYTTNNKAVVNVPIAINNGKDDTTFIDVVVYGNIAETTYKYCKKGDLIGAQATIKNNNWTDKDGKNHYDYKFMGYKVTFLSTKKENVEEAKKEENTNVFETFGEEIEINDRFLD